MQKKIVFPILAISILSCCLLFGGCGQSPAAPSAEIIQTQESETTSPEAPAASEIAETTEPVSVPETSEILESSEVPETDTDIRKLTLSVVNMCGVDIGMVAVIDPVTGEQVNLDSLADEESLSMEADWPSTVKEFQWALYNTDGELCIEGKTDISTAKTSATLLLTGDGDLEKVEELFE